MIFSNNTPNKANIIKKKRLNIAKVIVTVKAMAGGIHKGESTHSQDQVIKLSILSAINTTVKSAVRFILNFILLLLYAFYLFYFLFLHQNVFKL